jgi:hypothetical protein
LKNSKSKALRGDERNFSHSSPKWEEGFPSSFLSFHLTPLKTKNWAGNEKNPLSVPATHS